MGTKTDNKDEIYFAVCNAILKLEFAKGPLKWTVSEVARESGITRSLIYYYFGKEKKTVLQAAYKFIIEHFYNLDNIRTLPVRERLKLILQDLKSMPYLMVLFYMAKGTDSEFGRLIQEKEKALLAGMKKEFPHLSEQNILEIYLMELGAMVYHLPPFEVEKLFSLYEKAR